MKAAETLLRFLVIISASFSFIYLIICMVFAGLANSSMSSNTFQYFQLLDNWSQSYISNISVVTSPADCPIGYTPLFDYFWKGTEHGCDCRYASIFYDAHISRTLQKGACTYNETRAGCREIMPISGVHMNVWRSYKKICKKKPRFVYLYR